MDEAIIEILKPNLRAVSALFRLVGKGTELKGPLYCSVILPRDHAGNDMLSVKHSAAYLKPCSTVFESMENIRKLRCAGEPIVEN